jgi:hypothetical protein
LKAPTEAAQRDDLATVCLYGDRRGTDADYPLTHFRFGRIPQRQWMKPAIGIDLDHGVIACAIGNDSPGFKNPSVVQLDENRLGLADNVLAGQDITLWVNNKSGAETSFGRKRRLSGNQAADQLLHVLGLRSILGNDGDHALLDALHDWDEKVERVKTAANRVLTFHVMGPFFAFHQSLPLQQIGMYHSMANAWRRDAQMSTLLKSIFLIDIIKK